MSSKSLGNITGGTEHTFSIVVILYKVHTNLLIFFQCMHFKEVCYIYVMNYSWIPPRIIGITQVRGVAKEKC